ncbi:type VI immunity family protein [Klebsiella quasivariicola]|uniref:type VI immunity family protein n=1 Tax=Klebsiella quasivariicola TaxID=2026240 RepID=UPI00247AA5C2|nr:type VI immunity family protein [Klebsiella quasivariicola]
MDTEKHFFENFDEASWEFTYGHLDNMDYNVLQVGLTATFYINEGWSPENREAMANAVERYVDEFGDKLKWGFLGDVNKPEPFVLADNLFRKQRLSDLEDDTADIQWSSEYYKDYVSDYQINIYSPAGWFEHIHGPVSYIRLFLPVSELKNNGRECFEKLVLDFCQLLQPMHGLAGLGTQQLYDDNPYQYLECEVAQNFTGIDITTSLTDKGLRNGIRSVNWYTILSNEWVEKAGGLSYLERQFAGSNIKVLPYSGGVVIRAGDWPALGWVEKEAKPELYVRVNQVLKSVRTPSFGSFHLGSNAGEIRLNETLTAEWQKRFDVELSITQPVDPSLSQKRITAKSGDICPHSGRWVTLAGGHQEFVDIQAGTVMPEATKYQSNMYAPEIRISATWNLLNRDDGESVFKK